MVKNKKLMRIKLYLSLILALLYTGCRFTFVGIIALKSYKVKYNKEVLEKALIDVQYEYPEIRIPITLQNCFQERDVSSSSARINSLTKEDSIYLSTPIKDYFRTWNESKIFVFSASNDNYIYTVRILDAQKRNCLIGVTQLSIKQNNKYLSSEMFSKNQIDSAMLVFESDILSKIKDILNK